MLDVYHGIKTVLARVTTILFLSLLLTNCVVAPAQPGPYYGPVIWYDYWYYPYAGIYFDIHRNLYFYHHHGRWVSARKLPKHYHGKLGHHVKMRLKDKRPHVRHKQHIQRYPSKHYQPRRSAPQRPDRPPTSREHRRREQRTR